MKTTMLLISMFTPFFTYASPLAPNSILGCGSFYLFGAYINTAASKSESLSIQFGGLGDDGAGTILNPAPSAEFKKIVTMPMGGFPHIGNLMMDKKYCSLKFDESNPSFNCDYSDPKSPLTIAFSDTNHGQVATVFATAFTISTNSKDVSVRIVDTLGQVAQYHAAPNGCDVE